MFSCGKLACCFEDGLRTGGNSAGRAGVGLAEARHSYELDRCRVHMIDDKHRQLVVDKIKETRRAKNGVDCKGATRRPQDEDFGVAQRLRDG